MSSPIVIHLYRPYASEEEYLASERFSIEAKSMLLIDQPPLPLDTAVVFDVTLDNGQKPIRAEGRVVGHVQAEGGRPGGLRVRFRRFGAATKAFIDRAVNGTPAVESKPAVDSSAIGSMAPVLDSSPMASIAVTAAAAPEAPLVIAQAHAAREHATTRQPLDNPNESDETSGIHKKTPRPAVAAPVDRDALLARLRGRRVS